MNLLDFLLIIIVGYSVVTGFMAGLARVGIGFAATVAGVICGFWLYRLPGRWLQDYLRSETASNLLGFFVVFSAVVLAGGVLARILASMFKWAGLSWLDRLLGGGFGFLRGVFLALAIVTVITAFAPSPPPRFIVTSKIMPYVTAAGSVFASIAPHELKESYRESATKLRQIWERVNFQGKPERLRGESF